VEPYVLYNKKGKAFQIFYAKDDLQPKGGQAVTLSNEVWHWLKQEVIKSDLILGEPTPSVHNFGRTIEPTDAGPAATENPPPAYEEKVEEQTEEQSDEESSEDKGSDKLD